MKERFLTAERMLAIESSSVIDGDVDADGNLILMTRGGSAINAGLVRGPKGDKGDPGDNVDAKAYSDAGDVTTLTSAKSYFDNHRIVKGVALGNSVDLNTLTQSGYYTQTANAQAATGTNYPRPLAGVLEVRTNADGSGVMVWQQYKIYGGYNPENYVRTLYNGTWTVWAPGGTTGSLIRVASQIKTTSMAAVSASAYAICSITLPNPQLNDVYRVYAKANFEPDTIGMYTELEIKHGVNASTGGTQIEGMYVDHRAVGRQVGGFVMGEFTYTGTSGATNYNVVSVGLPGGGSSRYIGAVGRTAALYVDRIL